jgi:hypothetical protein
MEKQNLEPAFPNEVFDQRFKGISKRLYLATHILQGIIASNQHFINNAHETAVGKAYNLADELLKQEQL